MYGSHHAAIYFLLVLVVAAIVGSSALILGLAWLGGYFRRWP